MEFILDLDLGCDDAPSFVSVVLKKDYEHECLSDGPSSSCEVGLDSVVILVVNFFREAVLKELVYLLPVLAVHPLLLKKQLVLL